MKLRYITLGALLFSLADTANAADLLRSYDDLPEIRHERISPFADWAGRYGGLSAAYTLNPTGSLQVDDAIRDTRVSKRKFMNSDGWSGSLFAGYNFQSDSGIVGIEADIGASNISDTREIYGGGSASFDIHVQGSVRARLGYQLASALVYSTAGLAIADIEYAALASDGSTFSDNEIELGYTTGLGVDYALTPRLFSRFEYRYTGYFGGKFLTSNGSQEFEFDSSLHSFHAGAGVRF